MPWKPWWNICRDSGLALGPLEGLQDFLVLLEDLQCHLVAALLELLESGANNQGKPVGTLSIAG